MSRIIRVTHRKYSCFRSLGIAWVMLPLIAGVAQADSVQGISIRNSSLPLPSGGNGDSVSPWISSDGRYILFSSSANNLVPGDNGQQGLDVLLRDRIGNTTTLVSANSSGTGGGNGDSLPGQISTFGRYVVFQSDSSDLIANDTNGVSDIFMRDLFTGTTRLISVATGGGSANGASTDPVMTPDGTCVAFISVATNLVAGDTNDGPDVFVRDLITQTTWLLSVGAAKGNMATPIVTPDGRNVVFFSDAQGLSPGVPAGSKGEVYVRDRLAATTTWVSTNAATIVSNILHLSLMPSSHPAISDDGRYVAFRTGWTNSSASPGVSSVAAIIFFLYDSLDGTTTIVSTNGFPPWAYSEDVYGPEMTPDGRFVAYVERQSVVATNSSYSNVRLWDRQTGTNVLVSANQSDSSTTNTRAHAPALSHDGRYVTFLSDATNIVSNVASNGFHIYRRDIQTSTTELVDVDTNGVRSMDQLGTIPLLSADGGCVVFSSFDSRLVGDDFNRAMDVFLWDSNLGTNELVSRCDPLVGQTGNGISALSQLSFSADGGAVAFASYASDLVTNDFNQESDVFVRDSIGNPTILVSVGLGGPSHSPAISSDGRFVTFISGASNLVAGDMNTASDVFRRDLQAGTTELVSVSSDGASLLRDGDSSWPVSSLDGRYIAFLCRSNSSSPPTRIFWRDVDSGVTRPVFGDAHFSRPISMSADGSRVAFFDSSARLYVWDATASTNIYTNTTTSLTSAAISPDGNRLLYHVQNQLFVYDLAASSNSFLYHSAAQVRSPGQWSGDGRYIAFVSHTNLVAGDNNGTNDVYLRDLQTGTLTLVSLNQNGTGSADGFSDSPAVSADGRFVAFRSFAADVLPGIVKPPSLILFDRLTGTNRLIVTGTTGTGWSSWVSRPALSTDGARLAFQSWDSGVVSGDLNRAGDVFAGDLNLSPATDTDEDGIPDWWTAQYFGHATGEAGDLSRAQDDADGDGMKNLDEYRAGTIPTSPDSVLALGISRGALRNTLLTWGAIPGKNYQIQTSTNLVNPDWQEVSGSISIEGTLRYFNLKATNSGSYFRILCTD